jgi:hypothetical protein
MKTTAREQVTLRTLIRELTGMNFGRATEHLDQGFTWYFQPHQANAGGGLEQATTVPSLIVSNSSIVNHFTTWRYSLS